MVLIATTSTHHSQSHSHLIITSIHAYSSHPSLPIFLSLLFPFSLCCSVADIEQVSIMPRLVSLVVVVVVPSHTCSLFPFFFVSDPSAVVLCCIGVAVVCRLYSLYESVLCTRQCCHHSVKTNKKRVLLLVCVSSLFPFSLHYFCSSARRVSRCWCVCFVVWIHETRLDLDVHVLRGHHVHVSSILQLDISINPVHTHC